MAKPITCADYDHFEIACMHQAEVECLLHDGETILGQAKTLKIESGREILIIQHNSGELKIALTTIKRLRYEGKIHWLNTP